MWEWLEPRGWAVGVARRCPRARYRADRESNRIEGPEGLVRSSTKAGGMTSSSAPPHRESSNLPPGRQGVPRLAAIGAGATAEWNVAVSPGPASQPAPKASAAITMLVPIRMPLPSGWVA